VLNRLLMVTHVPLRTIDGQHGLDKQTCRVLVRYAEQFDQVIYACPQVPEHEGNGRKASSSWQAIAELPGADRIKMVPLPWAYRLPDFIKEYKKTRQLLSKYIQEANYLLFTPSILIGDWSAVACLEAMRLKRSYAVYEDRVEYEVIRRMLPTYSFKFRLKEAVQLPLIKPYSRFLIRNSQVGLFQGQDCYAAFAPICRDANCVYDVHTQKSDQIDPDTLHRKLAEVQDGKPIKVAYVGRATEMKGAIDWIKTIAQVCHAGVAIEATWIGDGPLLSEMQQLADNLEIREHINFVGFVSDLAEVLTLLKQQHIFTFCHKTPESPRCLIEALVAGCPIVGYESAYARGLIAEAGGGIFVPCEDQSALAEQILQLHHDRSKLSDLIRAAATSGQQFDEESVFARRSNLIKSGLGDVNDVKEPVAAN
jgi:glycosyltransferase involved in cell wall biosynthesis